MTSLDPIDALVKEAEEEVGHTDIATAAAECERIVRAAITGSGMTSSAKSTVDSGVSISVSGSNKAGGTIKIEFDSGSRPSLFVTKNIYPNYPKDAYDIAGLLNDGYSVPAEKTPPPGAWRTREGGFFVESSIDALKALIGKYGIVSVD